MTREAVLDYSLPVAAFLAATGIGELAGAEDLGTAASFGQMAFMLAVVLVILKP